MNQDLNHQDTGRRRNQGCGGGKDSGIDNPKPKALTRTTSEAAVSFAIKSNLLEGFHVLYRECSGPADVEI